MTSIVDAIEAVQRKKVQIGECCYPVAELMIKACCDAKQKPISVQKIARV